MKLKLQRSQKLSILGDVKFSILAMVDLDPAEKQALVKYQLGNTLLYASEKGSSALANYHTSQGLGGLALSLGAAFFAKSTNQLITVDMLVSGKKMTSKDINELIYYEEEIRVACDNLARIMFTCKNFGGEEVINIEPFESEAI